MFSCRVELARMEGGCSSRAADPNGSQSQNDIMKARRFAEVLQKNLTVLKPSKGLPL